MVLTPLSFTGNNLTYVDQVIALVPQSGDKETLSVWVDVRCIHSHHLDEYFRAFLSDLWKTVLYSAYYEGGPNSRGWEKSRKFNKRGIQISGKGVNLEIHI